MPSLVWTSDWDVSVVHHTDIPTPRVIVLYVLKSSLNSLSVVGLLSLSVKGAEVASMTMDVIQSIPNLDWLSAWIKAYAFIHAGDNHRAINTIW